MPVGQFLGSKSKYVYETDSGSTYIITRDDTLATVAGSGLVVLDPAAPPAGAAPAPKRFTPRGVYWESTEPPLGARKFLVCGSSDAPLYTVDASSALIIDGVAGRITGRKGEQLSF